MAAANLDTFDVTDHAGVLLARAAVPARGQRSTPASLRLTTRSPTHATLATTVAARLERAAIDPADRIDRHTDPTRVVTDWRTWLQAAGVFAASDDDALDAVVIDLSLRRPRFVDWHDWLGAFDADADAGTRHPDIATAAIEGVLLGDATAVHVARLLARRTADLRYWRSADSSR